MHRDRESRWARLRRSMRRAGAWVATTRQPLLDASGLGLLAAAAGMLAVPAGVAAAGVACLIMSARLR